MTYKDFLIKYKSPKFNLETFCVYKKEPINIWRAKYCITCYLAKEKPYYKYVLKKIIEYENNS